MNEARLRDLGIHIKALLQEYEIEDEGFQLKIFVKQEYYDKIKENFSRRNPLDIVVGQREDDWGIDIMYLPPRSISK
ncbi:MAG: hypothetical protein H6672_05115 [Anaerolineaceae bacterium]|nr:hypothetical protein [Anaerolineaceae bacterium]